jgi:hypothetical protein
MDMETRQLAIIAAALAALESMLIIAGMLPPTLTYSPGNLVFLGLRFILLPYAGWLNRASLKAAASGGALVAAAGVVMLMLASFVGSAVFHRAVLGVSVSGLPLVIMCLITLVMNAAIGAIAASAVALLAPVLVARPKTPNPKPQNPKPVRTIKKP